VVSLQAGSPEEKTSKELMVEYKFSTSLYLSAMSSILELYSCVVEHRWLGETEQGDIAENGKTGPIRQYCALQLVSNIESMLPGLAKVDQS